METLEQLQIKIEGSYPRILRLEKTKKKRKESLHEFLIKFFVKWNEERNTIYVDNKEIQTEARTPMKRRSLGDIFMICKYYYPNITLKELIQELYLDLRPAFDTGFRTSYCHLIKKRVWYYDENAEHLEYDKIKRDEYGNAYRYYLAALKGEYAIALIDDNICPHCEEHIDDCECDTCGDCGDLIDDCAC